MSTYIAEPLSRRRIRAITYELRKILDLKNEVYFPVIPIIELILPKVLEGFTFEIVDMDELPNEYAVTYPEENKILIREDVYERAIEGIPRDRFTIAHEIGHLILHTDNRIALAREDAEVKIPPYKNPEWQANTFAAELLAPPHIIKDWDAQTIAIECGVSEIVGKIQLEHLE